MRHRVDWKRDLKTSIEIPAEGNGIPVIKTTSGKSLTATELAEEIVRRRDEALASASQQSAKYREYARVFDAGVASVLEEMRVCSDPDEFDRLERRFCVLSDRRDECEVLAALADEKEASTRRCLRSQARKKLLSV